VSLADPDVVRRALRLPQSLQYLVERWAVDKVAFCREVLQFDPTPKQARWLRAGTFAKTRNLCAGRRAGKSFTQAADDVHAGIFQPRSKFLNTARTYQQALLIPQEAIGLCSRTKIGRTLISDLDRSPFFRLTWVTGTEYWARSLQNGGDNVRGEWYGKVNQDEAAFGSKRDRAVILPTLADVNGTYSTTTTPNGLNFYHSAWTQNERTEAREMRRRLIRDLDEEVAPGIYGASLLDHMNIRWRSDENPWLTPEALAELRENLSPSAIDQELNAEFLEVEGALCKAADLAPVEEGGIRNDDLNPGGPLHQGVYQDGNVVVAGCDLGRWKSWSVLVVMRIDVRPWRVVSIRAFRGIGWEFQQAEIEEEVRKWRASILIDSTHGSVGDVLVDFLNIPHDRFEFTKPSKDQLLLRLKLAIERRLFVVPNDEELLRQLGLYGTDPEGDRDETWDYIMALALAVWQAEQNPGSGTALTSSTKRHFAGLARASKIKRFPMRRR